LLFTAADGEHDTRALWSVGPSVTPKEFMSPQAQLGAEHHAIQHE
jgi:hypothetical protein